MTYTLRRRVLMVSKALIVGIYQRKLQDIARHRDIELICVVPPSWRDERGEMPLERVPAADYQLRVLPLRFNGNFHLHHYAGLGHLVRELRPDIVHIDEEPYNAATWQMLYHAKRVGARTLFFSWQNIYRVYPPPFRWGESWVLNNVDYALVGTESAGEIWRQKGYKGAMAVIPQFGTDADLFQPATSRPDRPFTIGYFGRLVEEKGLFTLLDALAALMGDWRLRLVGGGPLREALQARAVTLGIADRVEFVGQISSIEMPQQYHEIDVLVLPSLTRPNWKEQYGRVLIEAMASGVPVIGSDSGAIPGVIGSAGLIFPEGNTLALTEHLQSLLQDPARRAYFARVGRDYVLSCCTHQRIADETVEIYRSL